MAKRRSRGSGKGGGWLTALVVGAGVVGAVYWVIGRPGGGKRRKRMGERNMLGPMVAGGQPRSMLRESIIGADKGMVQSVFGPPRAAGGVPVAGAKGRQAYWEADTWYYALDPGRKVAMAITFKGGVAREVEFVEGHSG